MPYVSIALALIELAMKLAPGIMDTILKIQTAQGGKISLEDIEALRSRIRPPEDYFK